MSSVTRVRFFGGPIGVAGGATPEFLAGSVLVDDPNMAVGQNRFGNLLG